MNGRSWRADFHWLDDGGTCTGARLRAGCAWGPLSPTLLADRAAVLECRVVTPHEIGQSVLVIGEIVHAETWGREPLVYRESDYY